MTVIHMKFALVSFLLALSVILKEPVEAAGGIRLPTDSREEHQRGSKQLDRQNGESRRRLESCADNPDKRFFDIRIWSCDSFAEKVDTRGTSYRDRFCGRRNVRDNCPETCSLCPGEQLPNSGSQGQSLAKVAAYYYPWWGDDTHYDGTYTREFLSPPQRPELGDFYDDTDPAVVNQHLLWSRQANIQVWIGSWWGPNKREDTTLRTVILSHENLGDMEISLIYETRNRVKETEVSGVYDFSNVVPDMEHIAINYFGHPNFLRIDGRPVIFLYVARFYNNRGILGEIITRMRDAASAKGYDDIIIVGDLIWRDPPSSPETYDAFDMLDGITNYDVYGNIREGGGLYAGASRVEQYRTRQVGWRDACGDRCSLFPSVGVGLNKKGKIQPLSRRLDENEPEGSLFQAMLSNAVNLVEDSADRILVVTSFNEWHEDTQIEPVAMDVPASNLPMNLTWGLDYEPYGELYLDLLRDGTTAGTPTAAPTPPEPILPLA